MSNDALTEALRVRCTCGGWVMLAALGHSIEADADSFREAARMERRGFRVERTTCEAVRTDDVDHCKYRGNCTTNPKRVADAKAKEAVEQLELTP